MRAYRAVIVRWRQSESQTMKVAAQSGLSVCCMCQVLRSDVSRLLDRQGQHDREDLKQVSICKESAVCQRNESGKKCTSHASAARTPSPICLGIFGVRPTTFDHCLLHNHDTNDVGFVRFFFRSYRSVGCRPRPPASPASGEWTACPPSWKLFHSGRAASGRKRGRAG